MSDIGLGLEKWLAAYKPYEWIDEGLRLAVSKSILNEWITFERRRKS